jgi:hypothetical protein
MEVPVLGRLAGTEMERPQSLAADDGGERAHEDRREAADDKEATQGQKRRQREGEAGREADAPGRHKERHETEQGGPRVASAGRGGAQLHRSGCRQGEKPRDESKVDQGEEVLALGQAVQEEGEPREGEGREAERDGPENHPWRWRGARRNDDGAALDHAPGALPA